MTIFSTTNLHNIARITMERVDFGDFVSHRFTFETEDGAVISVDAFAAEQLTIEHSPDRVAVDRAPVQEDGQ